MRARLRVGERLRFEDWKTLWYTSKIFTNSCISSSLIVYCKSQSWSSYWTFSTKTMKSKQSHVHCQHKMIPCWLIHFLWQISNQKGLAPPLLPNVLNSKERHNGPYNCKLSSQALWQIAIVPWRMSWSLSVKRHDCFGKTLDNSCTRKKKVNVPGSSVVGGYEASLEKWTAVKDRTVISK